MTYKRFEIQSAAYWLTRFERKRKGEVQYCNPGMWTEPVCKKIINACSDKELHDAGGVNIKQVRELAKQLREGRRFIPKEDRNGQYFRN